jgi:hypothetical protein
VEERDVFMFQPEWEKRLLRNFRSKTFKEIEIYLKETIKEAILEIYL